MTKHFGKFDIIADGELVKVAEEVKAQLAKLGIKVDVNTKKKKKKKRRIRLVADKYMMPSAASIKAELKKLGVNAKLIEVEYVPFPSGEFKPIIRGNVRNTSVFYLCNMNGDPNIALIKQDLTHQALYLADAKRITTIAMYLPYMRQDRKDEPRTAISAKQVIEYINNSKRVKRIVTTDIHSEQLLSNFDIPHDHLPGYVIFAPWIKEYVEENLGGDYDKVVVVAPDEGSFKRARKLAKRVHNKVGIAMFNKDRDGSEVDMLNVIGADVKGKVCILNDDMMDTCGTIIKAAKALLEMGAAKVILSATHAVFSPTFKKDEDKNLILDEDDNPIIDSTAYEKLEAAGIEVVVTDSLFTEAHDWLKVLPWTKYLAHTIYQNTQNKGGSISKLIRNGLPQAA